MATTRMMRITMTGPSVRQVEVEVEALGSECMSFYIMFPLNSVNSDYLVLPGIWDICRYFPID